MTKIFKHKYFSFSLILFGLIYCVISLVNHYLFRTYALDLGAYTNALYDYSHLQFNDSTVFKEVPENLLADHFDFYLIILSPLSLIFKTYTLLIVQIVMVLVGAKGVFKLFDNHKIGWFASLYFLSFFGVFSAISFDYHSNVIATCLIPWLFYYVKQKNIYSSILFFILIIIAKENMALWTLFISIGLFILNRKHKQLKILTATFAFLSIAYFILTLKVFMPYFSNSGSYHHFHYSVLGSNMSEAIIHLITHPVESIKTLFVNHTTVEMGDYIKLELHLFLLLSGLPILIKKPVYLLMLIPIYFQKLFHDNIEMWGIHNQYSIEFAPILAIGIFSVINDIKNIKLQKLFLFSVIILNLGCSIRLMDNTVYFTNKPKIRIYKESHYIREYDYLKVHNALKIIPNNEIVSSQSAFLPHLAYRDNIYQFPIIKDAQYIIFSVYESAYPLKEEEFKMKIEKLTTSNKWKVEYQEDGFTILKHVN